MFNFSIKRNTYGFLKRYLALRKGISCKMTMRTKVKTELTEHYILKRGESFAASTDATRIKDHKKTPSNKMISAFISMQMEHFP